MVTINLALFLLECLVAFLFVFGMLFVASAITERYLNGDSLPARWCAAIVIGLWIASVGFHLLIITGYFRVWTAALGMACLIGIVRTRGYSLVQMLATIQNDVRKIRTFLFSSFSLFQQSFLFVLGVGALLLAARCCLLPPLSWDTLTYHAVKAAMWVQNGHPWLMEAPGGWFNYRAYPGGGEVFHAWSMLPFHSDFLMGAVDFVQWLCLLPVLVLLGDCIGIDSRDSFIAALFCLFIPSLVFSVGSCYVDITFTLAFLLGVGFLAKFLLLRHTKYIILAFMAMGIAGSIKYTAYFPICAILGVILSNILIRHEINSRILLSVGTALLMMLASMAPWLLYNYHLTGYPLFPFSVKIAGMTLGLSSPVTDWLLHLPGYQPYDLRHEAIAVATLFSWPLERDPNFGYLILLPFGLFFASMVSLIKQRFWVGLLLITAIGSIVGSFYLPDFSVVRQVYALSSSRFLWGAFIPIVLISPLVVHDNRRLYCDFFLLASASHLIMGAWMYWNSFEFPYLALAASLIAIGLGTILFYGGRLRQFNFIALLAIILVVCLTGLFWIRNDIRNECVSRSFFFHDFPRYWAHASTSVDAPDAGRNIAITSGPCQRADNWFMYMFMGRSLENKLTYVPVSRDGSIQHHGSYLSCAESLSYESWLARLKTNGITEIMSFAPPSIELQWMREHPETFEQTTGGDTYGFFRVKAIH